MPFTASHPAAVLPLLRLGLPASALVIGSLAPDLPYYLPTPFTFVETHALPGALPRDVLLGLAAFLAWHGLLVRPLTWIAPEAVQRRVMYRGGWPIPSLHGFGAVCLALAAGALTHVVWDLFTHADGLRLGSVPALDTPVWELPVYRWLHLVSSVVGLAAIAWYGARWWVRNPKTAPADPIHPTLRWGIVITLLGWACYESAKAVAGSIPAADSRDLVLIDAVLAFIGSLAVGVIGGSVAWHVGRALGLGERERSGVPDTGGRPSPTFDATDGSVPQVRPVRSPSSAYAPVCFSMSTEMGVRMTSTDKPSWTTPSLAALGPASRAETKNANGKNPDGIKFSG